MHSKCFDRSYLYVALGGGCANLLLVLLPCLLWGWPAGEGAWVMVPFLMLTTTFYAGECLAPANAKPDGVGSRNRDCGHRWLALGTGLLLLLTFWLSLTEELWLAREEWWLIRVGGALAMVAGVGLRILAIGTLETQFRSEPLPIGVDSGEIFPPQLVTRGVYTYLRHPSECGLLLLSLGAATLWASMAGWIVVVGGLLPLMLARLQIEERALRTVFGERYSTYAATTPALIPSLTRMVRAASRAS